MADLLHYIGRFEQYARYKTFVDIRSENHALPGIKILKESKILKTIDPDMREIVLRAI
ncbi:MAG: hypothetical protein JXN64_05560 [Spirochaetes bacterium]|nr:hypothetical protein [Spirochaetota bacterium]